MVKIRDMMMTVDLAEALDRTPTEVLRRKLREARGGLSLDRLAEAAHTSRQHLIKLEQGKHRPRPDMLRRIAEATGRPVEWFVESHDPPGPFPRRSS